MRKTEFAEHVLPQTSDIVELKRIEDDNFLKFETPISVLLNSAIASAVSQAVPQAVAQATALIADVVKMGTPVIAVAGTNTFTLVNNPTEGESITVGTETYIFTATPVGDFDVEIGLDAAATQANLLAVISDHSAIFTASSFEANVSTFTAKTKGAAEIGATVSLAGVGDGFSHATFQNGVDGTVASAGQIYVADNKVWFATDDCTVSESNFKGVTIS